MRRGDALMLRRWRNDPLVRQWSGTDRPVGLVEHARWCRRAMRLDDRVVLIGEADNGDRLGTVQYRRDADGAWVVSVTVAPGMRGRGVGTELLRAGEDWLRADREPSMLRALVHQENAASQRLFESAGYVHVPGGSAGFDLLVRHLPA